MSATAPEKIVMEPRGVNLTALRFIAMASPCELLVETSDHGAALALGRLVATEAWRIEHKYSRYRNDSLLSWIHHNRDRRLELDQETVSLLDFAKACHEVSGGLFDITSGILRRVWTFDGSDRLPAAAAVKELLPFIGFYKLKWKAPRLLLPFGMELDFGGIGKEYAVDRAFDLLSAQCSKPFLINLGGDLRTNRAPPQAPWRVGIERPDNVGEASLILDLERGALATSGDSRRYLIKDGVRYGHILNPKTGWPVPGAPRSVTVAASSCTEAGQLATLALLHGAGARQFLEAQQVRYWLLE
ncbi:MAG TPA: FAD:protein FMN transferase [Steroidobacteraceae bacterium]|jgi:thiamine biosynthesis lipoprotein|nr:FAD:protein FMN transferase [Steroidobacteraceae bacterium]